MTGSKPALLQQFRDSLHMDVSCNHPWYQPRARAYRCNQWKRQAVQTRRFAGIWHIVKGALRSLGERMGGIYFMCHFSELWLFPAKLWTGPRELTFQASAVLPKACLRPVVLKLRHSQNHLCQTETTNLIGLGWGPRACISKKSQMMLMPPVQEPYFENCWHRVYFIFFCWFFALQAR